MQLSSAHSEPGNRFNNLVDKFSHHKPKHAQTKNLAFLAPVVLGAEFALTGVGLEPQVSCVSEGLPVVFFVKLKVTNFLTKFFVALNMVPG